MNQFTGERFLPEIYGEISIEHFHRYAFAIEFIKDKRVLDLSCGDGYGSFMMSEYASSVLGVDISHEVILGAIKKYSSIKSNLDFQQSDATYLPLADNMFDVVVSFETIEHLLNQEGLLKEIYRVMKPEGLLIISSPNKPVYNSKREQKNEFHVNELDFTEFDSLLRKYFLGIHYYGQNLEISSVVNPFVKSDSLINAWHKEGKDIKAGMPINTNSTYFIACCSKKEIDLPKISPTSFYVGEYSLLEKYEGYARWAKYNHEAFLEASKLAELRHDEISQLRKELIYSQEKLISLQKENISLKEGLTKITNSNSWKNTKKFFKYFVRKIYKNLSFIFEKLPLNGSQRQNFLDFLFRYFPYLFRHTRRYQLWNRQKDFFINVSKFNNKKIDIELLIKEINFKNYKYPLVSIIIPTYGKLNITCECLYSIYKNLPEEPIEIILIEDCSGDKEMRTLENIHGLNLIYNEENIGFIKSCNKAAKKARGKYLHFLNNDTQVTFGWLDELLKIYQNFPDCGLVGSKLIYEDGSLQEAGGIVWKDATAWNYGKFDNSLLSKYNHVREVDYCSGASLMVETQVFNKVGMFDERYAPAYCEDSDLAFSIRQEGLKVYYQPSSVVIHHEGLSNGRDENLGVKANQLNNQVHFYKKWNLVLNEQNYENGKQLFNAVDRSKNKKNIVVIDHYVPQYDRDAGSRTMMQIIELLVKNGLNVKFWPSNLYYDEEYTPKLQQMGVEVFYSDGVTPAFSDWVKAFGGLIDYFFISRPIVFKDHVDSIKQYSKARILYYGHDIHHLRLDRKLKLYPDNKGLKKEIQKIEAIEKNVVEQADVVFFPSTDEVKYIRKYLDEKKSNVIVQELPVFGYTYFEDELVSKVRVNKDIIMVAGFAHQPNEDGIIWFIDNVWNHILTRVPDARLFIVGSNPTTRVQKLSTDNIIVTGYVSEDLLRNYYLECRVSIAPLRFGSGVKGKVVEAMRYALPIVATSCAAEGLCNTPSDGLFVIDDAKGQADAIVSLLTDDSLWFNSSANNLNYAKENFSTKNMWNALKSHIDIV